MVRKILLNINRWVLLAFLCFLIVGALMVVLAAGSFPNLNEVSDLGILGFALDIVEGYFATVSLVFLTVVLVATPLVVFYLIRRAAARSQSTALILLLIVFDVAIILSTGVVIPFNIPLGAPEVVMLSCMTVIDVVALICPKKQL